MWALSESKAQKYVGVRNHVLKSLQDQERAIRGWWATERWWVWGIPRNSRWRHMQWDGPHWKTCTLRNQHRGIRLNKWHVGQVLRMAKWEWACATVTWCGLGDGKLHILRRWQYMQSTIRKSLFIKNNMTWHINTTSWGIKTTIIFMMMTIS